MCKAYQHEATCHKAWHPANFLRVGVLTNTSTNGVTSQPVMIGAQTHCPTLEGVAPNSSEKFNSGSKSHTKLNQPLTPPNHSGWRGLPFRLRSARLGQTLHRPGRSVLTLFTGNRNHKEHQCHCVVLICYSCFLCGGLLKKGEQHT